MSAEICPTILASRPDQYKLAMQRLWFAPRLHIDLTDGRFAPIQTITADQTWWPANVRVDLHVMYANPAALANQCISLGPQLVIIHSEAGGDFVPLSEQLHHHGIEVGVALLPATPVDDILGAIDYIDHVLIFSGNLGHYGGTADLNLLAKVNQLRQIKPQLEIGWDGGANENNVMALVNGGVDVINIGSAISQAEDPYQAYAKLERIIGVHHDPTDTVN